MRYSGKLWSLADAAQTLHPAAEAEGLPPSFLDWLELVTPAWNWRWRHLARIRERLDRVTSGHLKRLMIFAPPRHGKSEHTTIRYPAYRLRLDPSLRVILGAYNQTLADKFSRKVRKIVREQLPLNPERKAASDWETLQGGGVRAAGVGAGITGMGANLAAVDDPIKGREEAESEAYRERVWEWWTDDLYTRLEPGAAVILILTRWHEDDLAGRILASEDGPDWEVVDLPAEALPQAERDERAVALGRPLGLPDELGRLEGEALCPERYDLQALAKIKRLLQRSYHALYQQWPQPARGSMLQRQWFAIVEAAPMDAHFVRYWDKAGTQGGGAYTAGVLMCRVKAGFYYVVDVVRAQLEASQREALIEATAHADADRWGSVDIWVEQEPGSSGKESAGSTIKRLAQFSVHIDLVSGDKVTRAIPMASQAEAGNIKLVKGPWNAAYVNEMASFPSGKYKDQVDASSGAFNRLALGFRRWSLVG